MCYQWKFSFWLSETCTEICLNLVLKRSNFFCPYFPQFTCHAFSCDCCVLNIMRILQSLGVCLLRVCCRFFVEFENKHFCNHYVLNMLMILQLLSRLLFASIILLRVVKSERREFRESYRQLAKLLWTHFMAVSQEKVRAGKLPKHISQFVLLSRASD